MRDLGALPGNTQIDALAINNRGQVVGAQGTPLVSEHAFLDNGGTTTDLGVLPGGVYSRALAMNNEKQIVGYANLGTSLDKRDAILYTTGVMIDLNALVTTASSVRLRDAMAINDAGEIAGTALIHGLPHAYLLTASLARRRPGARRRRPVPARTRATRSITEKNASSNNCGILLPGGWSPTPHPVRGYECERSTRWLLKTFARAQ